MRSRHGSDGDRRADALAGLELLEGGVRSIRLGGNERGRQRRFVEMLAGGERRRGFDGVDADDGAAQAFFVGTHPRGQIGHRRLVTQLAAQRFARRVELAPLAADAARPCVAAQRVDHRATDPPFGEGLELDAALFVEPVRGVDQPQHAILHQVADVDRVRHRRRHPAGERFDKGQAGDDSAVLAGGDGLGAHLEISFDSVVPVRADRIGAAERCASSQRRYQLPSLCAWAVHTIGRETA